MRKIDLLMSLISIAPVFIAGALLYGAYFTEVSEMISWDWLTHLIILGMCGVTTIIYLPLSITSLMRAMKREQKRPENKVVLVYVSSRLVYEVERDIIFNPVARN